MPGSFYIGNVFRVSKTVKKSTPSLNTDIWHSNLKERDLPINRVDDCSNLSVLGSR